MNSYQGIERRRSPRVAFPVEVFYKDRNKNVQGLKHSYGKDLSEHGLRMETYEDMPLCSILEIRLELRPAGACGSGPTAFNVLGEVVRSLEKKKPWLYEVGISFCVVNDDCRSALSEYVNEELRARARAREAKQPELSVA